MQLAGARLSPAGRRPSLAWRALESLSSSGPRPSEIAGSWGEGGGIYFKGRGERQAAARADDDERERPAARLPTISSLGLLSSSRLLG